MSDEADIANDIAQRHLDVVLMAYKQVHAVSNECIECGDTISAERQKATNGTQYCVDCATIIEKRR